MMRIYTYNENTTRKGQLWQGDESDAEDNGDVSLYGDGAPIDFIKGALVSLSLRHDMRPGGSGDDFRWSCDRSILKFFDGPEVYYCEQRRAWFPVE